MAQLGMETWDAVGTAGASYRVFVEYSEPTCSAITDSDPNIGCAYNHRIYRSGYRYRGRVIGHSAGTDSKIVSVGATFFTSNRHSWQLLTRHGEINRSDDSRHSFTPVKQNVSSVDLRHVRRFTFGDLRIGISAESFEETASGADFDETRAYAEFIYKLGGQ